MVRDEITKVLAKLTETSEIELETPENEAFGDYSTNVALQNESRVTNHESPRERAEKIVKKLESDKKLMKLVDHIEVAGPARLPAGQGFINFWLKKEVLFAELKAIDKMADTYGLNSLLSGKKILLEHTSPNPQTTIMLGHLRNNFLGMSVANLLEFSGAKVVKDCIINDRGVHICRSIWGYLAFADKNSGLTKVELLNFKEVTDKRLEEISAKVDWKGLLDKWNADKSGWFTPSDLGLKPDHANLIWYVLGSKAYKQYESVNKQVEEILQAWEKENSKVWAIWRQILEWSVKGYEETYQRIGSAHDWVWRESELYKGGKELVEKGLKEGIFQKSEGAVVTNLKKYRLSDTVAIKSDGTATYLVFDLNLTAQKQKKFPSDLYIWTIGAEQSLYFQQMFAICEQLGLGKRKNYFHLSYALVNFKGGKKMATREGSVVKADEILDALEDKARQVIKSSNQELRAQLSSQETTNLVSSVALGAIKYSLLRYARNTTMYYDIDESVSIEGNSGPYLQYTVARIHSLLAKARSRIDVQGTTLNIDYSNLNGEELSVLRSLIHFPEVVASAAQKYSPNLLCNYLFDLAQKYNLFYNNNRILGSDNLELRLRLSSATGQVLKNGLKILGIQTPERM